MTHTEVSGPRYEASLPIFGALLLFACALELLADMAGFRNHIPEPFDIFAHAGNMAYGAAVAYVVLMLAHFINAHFNEKAGYNEHGIISFSASALKRAKLLCSIASMAATGLLNLASETEWGLAHFHFLAAVGKTPDPLDLMYSCLWAAVVAGVAWRRMRYVQVWREA